MAKGIKLGVVGSSLLLDNPAIQAQIEFEIEKASPSTIILVPNPRFNAFVKDFAAKKGIFVDEMKPARPSWLGKDKQSRRKGLLRNLYANYILVRADAALIFFKKDSAGLTGKTLFECSKNTKLPIQAITFFG